MKLRFPVDALWAQINKIGAPKREYALDSAIREPLPPIVTSAGGIDVTIDEIDTPGGLLSSNGAQVVLYIPNQDKNIDRALVDGSAGKKVHIADCITLEQMRQKNRFQKYRAVVNVTGDFDVFGFSMIQRQHIESTSRLRVCINCLKYLNYKGYMTSPSESRKILSDFNLKDFFAENSTLFRYLPTSFTERKSGYSDDWKAISEQFRTSKNYTCESCHLDLNLSKHLLHAHHVDGNKRNNQYSNLKALCADCHRKQPLHDHMFIKAKDMALLQKLRKEQGILSSAADWEDLFALVDPPYAGLLRFYHRDKQSKPEIGYEITDSKNAVIAEIEIAWPGAKFGVVGNQSEQKKLAALGWKAVTLEDALREFRDRK